MRDRRRDEPVDRRARIDSLAWIVNAAPPVTADVADRVTHRPARACGWRTVSVGSARAASTRRARPPYRIASGPTPRRNGAATRPTTLEVHVAVDPGRTESSRRWPRWPTTFVPGDDAMRRAGLAAEALERAADPSQVAAAPAASCGRSNRVRPTSPSATGRRRSAGCPPPIASAYLLSWATSRIAQRRTAFHGLRKLADLPRLRRSAADGRAAEPASRGDRLPDGAAARSPPTAPGSSRLALPFDAGPATSRCTSTRTSSSSAPGPAAGSWPPRSPTPADRSWSWRPVRSSTRRRCRPTSWTPSPGCTSTTGCSRPGTARSPCSPAPASVAARSSTG